MQTYSHAIVNAAVGKQLEKRGIRPMYWALVVGSLIPDIPLTILTMNYIMKTGGFGRPPEELFGPAYDSLYFSNPTWVIGHNLFHAPLMVLLWLAMGWFFGWRRGHTWGKWFFWFALGTALHSLVDIPTHHHDGPLLLFPFNWSLRFVSPISYWDPNFYGGYFAIFEHLLDLFLIGTFVRAWWTKRQKDAIPHGAVLTESGD